MVIACTIAAVSAYAWIVIHILAGLVVFAIIRGFLSGAVVSLHATVTAGFVPEMRLMGIWIGMSFCFAAMDILIDSVIVGSIIDIAKDRFFPGLILLGSFTIARGIIHHRESYQILA